MILTDREIAAAIHCGQISIKPAPKPSFFSSTAVDLTLGRSIRRWKPAPTGGIDQVIDPSAPGFKAVPVINELTDSVTLPYDLQHGEFILAWTAEQVGFPTQSRLAARVEGKSSLARMGVGIHVTAPTIHAGFEGPIQLEVFNHGTRRVRLSAGMPICQLIIEQTFGTPTAGYQGQFQQQSAS